ncbi:MAG: 4-hydroxythreonine-4-phosphate dehydrogenase PdxA [Candidatus Omnitrophica bacterium]|nr:4-hydroxythreonine-4-phosphate dehydrogenase PdxA [Candidatus Omnitrophota bacterium]
MNKIRVGITMGDPAGIGPTIIAKALPQVKNLAEFIIIGDARVFKRVQNLQPLPQNYRFIDLNNVSAKFFSFGKIKAEYGRAAVEYLDKALALIKAKEIDCLVTCPVSKEVIGLSGINFFGHTEYFAQRCGRKNLVMLLLNKYLKIALLTRHIALKEVPLNIKRKTLIATLKTTYLYLKKYFLIKNPHLIICGVNPHASDNGLIGTEENRIIKPVLKKFSKTLNLDGPLSADIALYKVAKREYDCALAMYHDQALIALKLTDVKSAVNMTLGLPFIRTSPLHGTAFDIAQKPDLADPHSLIAAIKVCIRCTLNLRKD